MYTFILQHPHTVPDYGYFLNEEKIKKAPPAQILYAASRPLVTEADSQIHISISYYIHSAHITEQVLSLVPENRDHLEVIFCKTFNFRKVGFHLAPTTLACNTFMRVYAGPDSAFPYIIEQSKSFQQYWQILRQADPQAGQAIDYLGATRALCGDTGKRHLMQRREP